LLGGGSTDVGWFGSMAVGVFVGGCWLGQQMLGGCFVGCQADNSGCVQPGDLGNLVCLLAGGPPLGGGIVGILGAHLGDVRIGGVW